MPRSLDLIRRKGKSSVSKKGEEDEISLNGAEKEVEIPKNNIEEEEIMIKPLTPPEKSAVLAEIDDKGGLYFEAVPLVEMVFENLRLGSKINLGAVNELAGAFIESIRRNNSLLVKALFHKIDKFSIVYHSINVCIFSVKLGLSLRYEKDEIEKLALAGLLHDVGKIFISKEILIKPSNLSREEIDTLKQHPVLGYNAILKSLGEEYLWLAEIVKQENEREDGSGYPEGLRGDGIHEFAKIIGIVDIYEALTHQRPQRSKFTPFHAVKMIISTFKNAFPTHISKALVGELSAFPIGSFVKLNSNEIGRVLETNTLAPLRPKIEILYDSSGRKLHSSRIVDLNDHSILYITSPVFFNEKGFFEVEKDEE